MATPSESHKSLRVNEVVQSSRGGAVVTKSDSADLAFPATRLWIGGAGNVAVHTADGSEITFTGVTANSYLDIQVIRVLSTGTTATNIVALK